MPLDAYQLCPGGTNQKIKFCACGKDLLGELNHVLDKVGAGQRIAALNQISQLLKSHPSRACLLALQGIIQLETSNMEGLKATAAEFRQHYPENPIALAFSAIISASELQVDQAVDQLQRSLEVSEGMLQEATYSALGIVAQVLLYVGNHSAAMGHLAFQAGIAPEDDNSARELLSRLYASPDVSLLLKHHVQLKPGEANQPRLEAAEEPARRGCWRQTCDRLKALERELPNEPAVLAQLAQYQGWLGQTEEKAQTLHRLARLDSVDLDTAVEAEATAQLLTFPHREKVDEVSHVYPISDADRVMEVLLSEKQVVRIPGDLSQLGGEDSPPPRGAFWLLDREQPASGKYLQLGEIPNVLGEMYLYGRETDREARVEFVTMKAGDYDLKRSLFEKLLGDFRASLEKEEVVRKVPAEAAAMLWRWRLPDDTPSATQASLIEEKRRDIYLNTWPNMPLEVLDGKAPAEVAGDPQYRTRLLGAILLLELACERAQSAVDLNELRAKLGLPVREPIDPATVSVFDLPPVRLHLLKLDALSDDELRNLSVLCAMVAAPRALRRICLAMLQRPAFAHPSERARIFRILESSTRDVGQMLEFNRKGREAAEAAGASPAPWLISELQMRLLQGNAERFSELLNILQSRHLREPGVAQALQTILSQLGAGGQPGGQPAAASTHPPGLDASGPSAAPGGEAVPGPVWTPGGSTPPTPSGDKPKLWTPGMD